MITVNETLPAFDTFFRELGYDPASSLFFDIETTGFSPASSELFLIGVLRCQNTSWTLTQLLCERSGEEAEVLRTFLSIASQYDTLIHFNGSTFDLPYITKKAAQYRFDHTLADCASLDLYQKFRSLGKTLGLTRQNQSSFETFLGWHRADRLTGKHMVTLFKKYLACGAPEIQSLLLLHNHDDMIGMTKVLQMSAYMSVFRGDILRIENVCCSLCDLRIDFSLKRPLPAPIHFDAATGAKASFPFSLSATKDTAALVLPLNRGTLSHFFPDYKNYYYLPLEDQAIHKSVAGYVDPAYRTPAKPSNCYIKKSGVFLPQPEELFTPSFRVSYDDPVSYFACTEAFLSDKEKLFTYLCSVLPHCLQ